MILNQVFHKNNRRTKFLTFPMICCYDRNPKAKKNPQLKAEGNGLIKVHLLFEYPLPVFLHPDSLGGTLIFLCC